MEVAAGCRRALTVGVALLLAVGCSDPVEKPGSPFVGGGGFPAGGSGGDPGHVPACDQDDDGHASMACGGDDCLDADASVFPGATELCDRIDQNCDGVADEGCECLAGELRACWSGGDAARGVGACRDGVQRCSIDGVWGDCEGEVLPELAEPPGCDGVDQDCDGETDAEECRSCPGGGPEICGNGLDDDCSGEIDDAALCTLDCSAANPRDPGDAGLACCFQNPQPAYSFTCHEWGGDAVCSSPDRTCFDLDGDPSTRCVKECDGVACRCGEPDDMGRASSTPACGFLTPCARVDCDGRTDQPCYGGPPGTLGVGVCRGGRHSCGEDGEGARAWGACEGQVLPGKESCGNGLDDDCDGLVDESDGSGRACPSRPACDPGAFELCGNGLDDDCDGFADEACVAAGASQACWTGSILDRNVGACRDGTQVAEGGTWGPCEGQVLPRGEICGDGVDSNCNGLGGGAKEDPFCCVPSAESCNGLDDDCDGMADEGVLSRCGTCGGSCYGLTIDDLADCDAEGRTCTSIMPDLLSPSSITLMPGAPPTVEEHVYVTEGAFNDTRLAAVDPRTGGTRFSTVLEGFVYRLATAPDGSVWLAYWGGMGSRLEHRSRTGALICVVPGVGTPGTLALDTRGDVWFTHATGFEYTLRRVSGSKVVTRGDGTKECEVLDLASGAETDVPVENGAIVEDVNHRLWILGKAVRRVDLLSPRGIEEIPLSISYGPGAVSAQGAVGVDGEIYIAPDLRRIDPGGPFDGSGNPVHAIEDGSGVQSIALAPDGTIWAREREGFSQDYLVHRGPSGAELYRESLPTATGFGNSIAMDAHGKVWTGGGSAGSGYLRRFDPLTRVTDVFTRPPNVTVYHGSTNRSLMDVLRRRGAWTQTVDAGAYDVRWNTLSWSASVPAGSRSALVARFADVPDLLAGTSQVCGPFEASPADIAGCSGGRRFARIEIHLSGARAPAVSDVTLTWDRR